jgi:hypothetical protein
VRPTHLLLLDYRWFVKKKMEVQEERERSIATDGNSDIKSKSLEEGSAGTIAGVEVVNHSSSSSSSSSSR